MASPEQERGGSEDKSVWRKSTAIKIGAGMVVAGAFFNLSFAAIGLGVVAGSWLWHKREK
ncbi:MAG: hypothetical protein UU34_C0009G0003 [Candidatus Curtissbacteria bacterium GW2011_GWA1_41_11]|uniref:Uncharacterized protein n=1 Tax=Candidatus Curtissbacteria bacterium GW2011_GWA1_41_11 TaxID=1618409 RepID=A0A0G0WQS5_9BACT|nr:MAG: hypothetical protein UU34_C0009G0003 [Candidatus Curtissbacteria bacterium GW2011_GWA1_41_11]